MLALLGGGRNYSIDLLKIFSMTMVLGLHTNSYGGFLSIERPQWYVYIVNYYEHLCIVAVNVFIIISAWFLRDRTCSVQKILSLLITILFWTTISLCVVKLLGQEVSLKWIAKSIPFLGRAYDFLSGYIVMYMVSPVLNNMLNNSTKRQRFLLCIGSFFIFSMMGPLTSSHYLLINSGYSFVWFICLYIMTSYIKEKAINIRKYVFFQVYILLSFLAACASVNNIPVISDLSYNNVVVTICAFSLFLFFKDIKLTSKRLISVVSFLSPMTLGVFLIHDHNLMEQYYLKLNIYRIIEGYEWSYVILFPIFLFLVYIFCSILEYLRIKLFDLLKVPSIISKIAYTVDDGIDKVCNLNK